MGNLRDGEVDNGGVLLHKEVVLGEALDAEDQVGGQFGQLELLEEILFVGFVLLQERDTHTHTQTMCPIRSGQRCLNQWSTVLHRKRGSLSAP